MGSLRIIFCNEISQALTSFRNDSVIKTNRWISIFKWIMIIYSRLHITLVANQTLQLLKSSFYIHILKHMYVHTCRHTDKVVSVCLCAHTQLCVCVCRCTNTQIRLGVFGHARAHAHNCVYAQARASLPSCVLCCCDVSCKCQASCVLCVAALLAEAQDAARDLCWWRPLVLSHKSWWNVLFLSLLTRLFVNTGQTL